MGRKIIIYIAALFIVFNLTLVLLVLVLGGNSTPPKIQLPKPNGYDDFVAAALKVSGNVSGFATNSKEDLSMIISNNTESFRLIKHGLGEECRVPVEFNTNFANASMGQIGMFRNAAYLLVCEGKVAELEGRTNDALKGYLDGIRFGQENCRGGLLVTRMVGMACEKVASARLDSLIAGLDSERCKAVVRALEAIDAKEEPAQQTVQMDDVWSRSVAGFRDKLARAFLAKTMKRNADAIVAKINANTLHRRETMIRCAVQAYEMEKGNKPAAVSDLVPGYLKSMPKDPETGKELPFVR